MAILNIAVVALLSEPTSLSIDTVCQCKGITASEYLEPYSPPAHALAHSLGRQSQGGFPQRLIYASS